MTYVQTIDQVPMPAQAAMKDAWANYGMGVQTGFATSLEEAWHLFDGTVLVPSVWQKNIDPWILRGRPKLVLVE